MINLHVSDMEIIPADEENNLVNPTTVNMQDTVVISKQNKKTGAVRLISQMMSMETLVLILHGDTICIVTMRMN